MVYISNWVIICYLPPIKGTRKLHWCKATFELRGMGLEKKPFCRDDHPTHLNQTSVVSAHFKNISQNGNLPQIVGWTGEHKHIFELPPPRKCLEYSNFLKETSTIFSHRPTTTSPSPDPSHWWTSNSTLRSSTKSWKRHGDFGSARDRLVVLEPTHPHYRSMGRTVHLPTW